MTLEDVTRSWLKNLAWSFSAEVMPGDDTAPLVGAGAGAGALTKASKLESVQIEECYFKMFD